MSVTLFTKEVGPYSMNTYVLIDEVTNACVIIDPGGDPDLILEMAEGTKVEKILITHGHADHVMALADVKRATGAPIYIHPEDAANFGIDFDVPLEDGDLVSVGDQKLKVILIPGHTPGQCCFDLGDGRIIVGDTVFVGGPGRTASSQDFATTMVNMQNIVFQWPDETRFYPGHGPSGIIGLEKPAFEAFKAHGWPADTQGDVTWG